LVAFPARVKRLKTVTYPVSLSTIGAAFSTFGRHVFPLILPLIPDRLLWRRFQRFALERVRYFDIVRISRFRQFHRERVRFCRRPFCFENILRINILVFPKRVSVCYFELGSEKIRLRHVLAADQKGSARIFQAKKMASVVAVRIIFANCHVVGAFWDCVDTLHRN
jgi:hypothetical protein